MTGQSIYVAHKTRWGERQKLPNFAVRRRKLIDLLYGTGATSSTIKMMIADDNSITNNTSNIEQSCTAPVGEAQRRRSLEAIAQLSFGFFGEDGKDMGTSEEEEEKPQAPWKVTLKPTGKGGDIRQGVSLAAPITFFPKDDSRLYHDGVNSLQLKSAETMERKTKDDSRLYHEGVNNLTLRETEIQMRKATGSSELERPKLRNRSKSPVPNAPKPTSRDRSLSPVPDRSKGANRSRSKTPRSATPETTEKAVPVPSMEEKKEALADQEQTDNGSGMTPQPTAPEVSERPALVPVTGEKKQAPVRQQAPNKITDKKLSELKEQVQDLQRQLKKSKGKIQDLSTENKILTQQLVQGRQAVLPRTSSNCTSCKESKASLAALKQEKGVLESNIKVLMDQVGTVQKEKENFQEQFMAASSSHEKEVQDMKSQLISQQDLENRNLTLQDTITKIQKEKECLQGQLEASTVEHQKELQELRSHLEAQEDSGSNNQALQERIVSLKKEKGDLLVELETSSGKHQEELQEVQFQLEEQTTQAASLQNNLEQATTDSQRVEQLTLELDASNRDSQVLQVALSGAQVETAALQSQLAKDTAQVESLKQEVEVVSRDAQKTRNSVTKLQSEMDAARDGLEQSQTQVQELQNERDNVIAKLQEAEEQRGNLQLAAAERSAKLQQLTVQVAKLLETCKKNEADKSTMKSDFLDQIQAKEERLNDLQKENDAIESEKQEIKLRLEEQIKECQSIRRKLEEAVFEKGRANDSIVKLQTEAELTKQEFQKVQQSLKEAQQERDEALSNLKATEAKGREVIESSMEENKKSLVEAQEKIAALEAAVSSVEAAKKDVELDYVERVDAQERKIQEMKQENDAMETQLTTVTVEKKDAQHLIAEKEKVMESTNLQLEEAQQQLKEAAFENEVVLEKLNATVDKCQAAMAATEAMKGFLEEDEKTILRLHSKMNKMEADLLKRVTTSTERDKVGLGFEVDVEALERGMNFPTDDDEDSLAYLDVDVQEHSKNRRSSIMALEELERELKTLMCSSNEILPGVKNGRSSNSSPKSGSRKQSMNGGRQMSLFVKQKQRDSIEEEVLADIRET